MYEKHKEEIILHPLHFQALTSYLIATFMIDYQLHRPRHRVRYSAVPIHPQHKIIGQQWHVPDDTNSRISSEDAEDEPLPGLEGEGTKINNQGDQSKNPGYTNSQSVVS